MTDTHKRGSGKYLISGEGWVDNPINEEGVSSDAQYLARCASQDAICSSGRIVMHLWIIFVLMPFALGVAFVLLK
jgi:hypothetical protein